MSSLVEYQGDNAASYPSPKIWADFDYRDVIMGKAFFFEDDFVGGRLAPTITTTIGMGPYTVFGGAGATLTYPDGVGGELQLFLTDADQAVNVVTEPTPFRISANLGKLWFEARVKTSTITANEQAFFVGLAGVHTQSATVPLTATGALADTNLVGFHKPEANTAAFDASYRANGVAAVEVNADIGALVAGTYVKLGMVFDPKDSNKLKFYINGVEQAATKTIPDNTGTDFPADVGLGLCIAALAATSDDETLTLDWWRCAQMRTS